MNTEQKAEVFTAANEAFLMGGEGLFLYSLGLGLRGVLQILFQDTVAAISNRWTVYLDKIRLERRENWGRSEQSENLCPRSTTPTSSQMSKNVTNEGFTRFTSSLEKFANASTIPNGYFRRFKYL